MESIPQRESPRKKKRLDWFRVYTLNRRLLEEIAPEKVGLAFLDAMRYFEGGGASIPAYDDTERRMAFRCFKLGADDSLEEYRRKVEGGKRGAEIKKNGASIPKDT